MATTLEKRPPRVNREFRLMFRSTLTAAGKGPPEKSWVRQKLSRTGGSGSAGTSFVDELSKYLLGKVGHWALVVLEPSPPPPKRLPGQKPQPRPPIRADDPRIQRVFELRRKFGSSSPPGDDDERNLPETPNDSDQEDRHSDDEGFPEMNIKGEELKMQISETLRHDFVELKYEHLGGVCWEILTGIEARTKFTDSELRHEADRIWKRQQNYHLRGNNCQNFCVLLAIAIRAKNHSLLRVLHGQTVKKQIKELKLHKK